MTLRLTDEQQMLRDSVARFLDNKYDFAAREKRLAGGDEAATAIWQEMAELGWIGACLPEKLGGFGGPAETAIIMQEFGRRLVVEPLLECAIAGSQLLAALDQPTRDDLCEKLVEGKLQVALATHERHSHHDLERIDTVARRSEHGWSLSGVKIPVANGDRADLIFVTARIEGHDGISLFCVPRTSRGLECTSLQLHDAREAARLSLADCAVEVDALAGEAGQGLAIVERALDHACAALCNEAVGSCDHVLQATIEYLKTRVQYDAPLARLQVLQHRVAEMFVATEQARVMAGLATEALGMQEDDRRTRVSAARVAIDEHTDFVCKQAVQLHGGMGVSEELDIAHHLKRAMVATLGYGDSAWHLDRYMRLGHATT